MAVKIKSSGTMVSVNVEPASAPTGYQGTGDIVASAYAWWGLRAYTAASIGQNAVDLFFTGDSAVVTYATIAGGGLPLTTIATDLGIHGGVALVDKLWDQTGNARHLTAVGRPSFSSTGNGLTVPSMGFVAASNHELQNTSFGTQPQPLTYGVVANHTASAAAQNLFLTVNGGNVVLCCQFHVAAVNDVSVSYAGTASPTTAWNDGSWASFQSTFTNTTGDMSAINAAQGTGTNCGANTLTATAQLSHASALFDGFVTEAGIWPIAFTGTQLTNMYLNQKLYYGLP